MKHTVSDKVYLSVFILAFALMTPLAHAKKQTVPDSPEKVKALQVGQSIPKVTLKDITDNDVQLNKLVQEKPTVLIFYRGGWCPYCNVHLSELVSIEKDILKKGYQIVAISIDTPEQLKKTLSKNSIQYTLLSDSQAVASKKFGLAFRVDDETYKKYIGYGINLEEASGEKHHILPVPAVFLVNQKGKITYSHINPDYKIRLSTKKILDVIQQ
ncbi:MAG TPA: peroxiredoxin-like family protein [Oligoflexia bacterium]|nr:peroxiredoxin-like family protein [Oligoflexia bacterium]HMR24325.1 peroxiredoxin-like family protein [Oligoflexia bacterium]